MPRRWEQAVAGIVRKDEFPSSMHSSIKITANSIYFRDIGVNKNICDVGIIFPLRFFADSNFLLIALSQIDSNYVPPRKKPYSSSFFVLIFFRGQ